jgi:hypothetical protein
LAARAIAFANMVVDFRIIIRDLFSLGRRFEVDVYLLFYLS